MSEVSGCYIGADLVVLMACQTGIGQRVTGEGMLSMGRAFQNAGCRSVLVSLWSVSYGCSVKLIKEFFQQIKDGRNKQEALSNAKRMIREQGYKHPFWWAPFILVGRDE
jgi:CHAT domain-containing protein